MKAVSIAEHGGPDVWPMIENGTVKLVIDQTVPMADAAEGHRLMEAGGHLGKILLITDDNA